MDVYPVIGQYYYLWWGWKAKTLCMGCFYAKAVNIQSGPAHRFCERNHLKWKTNRELLLKKPVCLPTARGGDCSFEKYESVFMLKELSP